jgi:hypothetical protein
VVDANGDWLPELEVFMDGSQSMQKVNGVVKPAWMRSYREGWETMSTNYREYIAKLQKGENVSFRPRGNSMTPKLKSGQLVTIAPVKPEEVGKGDVVLCKVSGHHFVHLVTAVQGKRFQISNNHGHVNGWVGPSCIYGRLIRVED